MLPCDLNLQINQQGQMKAHMHKATMFMSLDQHHSLRMRIPLPRYAVMKT